MFSLGAMVSIFENVQVNEMFSLGGIVLIFEFVPVSEMFPSVSCGSIL